MIAVQCDNGIDIRFPPTRIDALANATTDQISAIVIEGSIALT